MMLFKDCFARIGVIEYLIYIILGVLCSLWILSYWRTCGFVILDTNIPWIADNDARSIDSSTGGIYLARHYKIYRHGGSELMITSWPAISQLYGVVRYPWMGIQFFDAPAVFPFNGGSDKGIIIYYWLPIVALCGSACLLRLRSKMCNRISL
jgi:hypothetical protein